MTLPLRLRPQRYPNVLLHTPEALERKWAALTAPPAASGLGLSPAQALRVLCRMPSCFSYSTAWLRARVAWLTRLGVPDPAATVTGFPALLGLSLSTLEDKCALLRAHACKACSLR